MKKKSLVMLTKGSDVFLVNTLEIKITFINNKYNNFR